MPITKSAIKRMHQNVKRAQSNSRVKREMRAQIKQLKVAIADDDAKTVAANLPATQKAIDKAVKKGLLHKNTASRRKSALAAAIAAQFPTKATAKTKKSPVKKSAAKPATAKKPTTKKSPVKKSSTKKA